MAFVWGIIVIVTTLPAWLGQMLAMASPGIAAKLGLTETQADVDPTFYADVRAESVWDTLTLWTLPLSGLLLALEHPRWTAFGLVGGSMYAYFAGRGILQRLVMRRRGIAVGKPSALWTNIMALAVWGLMGAGTIAMAARELSTGA